MDSSVGRSNRSANSHLRKCENTEELLNSQNIHNLSVSKISLSHFLIYKLNSDINMNFHMQSSSLFFFFLMLQKREIQTEQEIHPLINMYYNNMYNHTKVCYCTLGLNEFSFSYKVAGDPPCKHMEF